MMSTTPTKVAIVTGAGGGLGAASARLLAERGFTTVATDITEPAEPPQDPGNGAAVEFVTHDVADPESWRRLVEQTMDRHGRVDVLVNSAGIQGDLSRSSFEQTTLEHWRTVMAVNLEGTFLGCQAIMPAMKTGDGGSIVNISSLGSYYPTTYNPAYGASKAAITQLTKTVAAVGAADDPKVRCNSVHPGVIETAMTLNLRNAMGGGKPQENGVPKASIASRIPLGRTAQAEEIASVVAFLAADDSSFVTGSEYLVDGGSRLVR
ncbi:SDR family NAD(P)-dependent oxidoreductase [Rhodococcus koreensis]